MDKERLLNNFVWEGMTMEHRQACHRLKNKHYHQWIMAIYDVGTASYQASSLAKACAVTTWSNSKCFKCRETGHWKGGAQKTIQLPLNPLKLFPHPSCSKGLRWRRDCKFKTDKEGKPLLPVNYTRGSPQPSH